MKPNPRCGECGGYNTARTNIEGSKHPYLQYEEVTLTVECWLHKCADCGNIMMRPDDCKLLDEALEASLRRAL